MFSHNFKYAFKTLTRNRMLIFWTYAFPIILGTFFNMAFSNIESSEAFDVIDVAVVENDAFLKNEPLKQTLEALGDSKSDEQMFDIKYVSEKEAKKLLEEEKISGYLLVEKNTQKVVVNGSGTNETIFKSVIEEIIQTSDIIEKTAEKDLTAALSTAEAAQTGVDDSQIDQIYLKAMEQVQGQTARLKDISNKNLSYTMIEFYTLIAMTCLYGGIIGMTAMNQNLANMSSNGKRVAMSPTSKGKVVLSSMCAGYLIQLIGLAILFAYTVLILKVDYGTKFAQIILLALVGSLAGLTLGIAIGALLKSNENTKIGIVIAVTMLGCFLSGMMGITMKYIIDKNVPVVNKLNPASMITDGFYALYYYDTPGRYIFNMISLLIFSGIMLLISWRSLRRVKYDSI